MKQQFNDVVTTQTDEYVVTGWLQDQEIPKDTLKVTRNGKTVYEREER